jgi:hypothetical protein
VITDISPAGGFCDNDVNQACSADTECGGSTCNLATPNGTSGNIISIHGYNFGDANATSSSQAEPTTLIGKIKKLLGLHVNPLKVAQANSIGEVVFMGDPTDPTDDVTALDPFTVNNACNDSWTNTEIIVIIPAGVQAGPIKVTNNLITSGAQNFDRTDDSIGPIIPNFLANNLVRPGLCAISPVAGDRGMTVNYFGVNLGGEGYFGNYQNNVRALDSSFPNTLSGSADVPNINQGDTSTFVDNNSAKSNYLIFRKNADAPVGPAISAFDPISGPQKQYITIHGSGFGNTRGTNHVYFATASSTEANYNFPTICADAVWSDNQVIVKVPDGLANGFYYLKMNLGQWNITSNSTFQVNSALPLLPSVCKVTPASGPINSLVKVYGEYFGTNNTNGRVQFYNNKQVVKQIQDNGDGAQRMEPNVPLGALTGLVKVVKSGQTGNGLNFLVGSCSTNSDCGGTTPVCCPFGTPKKGQCSISLLDPINGCYANVPNSVFEWTFGTGITACSNLNQTNCINNPSCGWDPNTQACLPCDVLGTCANSYSCANKGEGTNSCPTGFCPNSPGRCSAPSGNVITDTGVGCADGDCGDFSYCTTGGSCSYNSTLNRCTKTAIENCSLATSVSLVFDEIISGVATTTTRSLTKECVNYAGADNHWVINVTSSCPYNWTNIGNNKCADTITASSCDACSSGSSCIDSGSAGVCATSEICPSGATCNGANNKCEKTGAANCDCCCEIGQGARDCCAPLTCQGTCGGGAGLGYCGGCLRPDNDIALQDEACNCANASGKFCEQINPSDTSGRCSDCTALNETDCTNHATSCCWDDKDGVCRGGDGEIITNNTGDARYGHCAYYGCNHFDGGSSTCGTSSSISGSYTFADYAGVYSTSTTNLVGVVNYPVGELIHNSITSCQSGCNINLVCGSLTATTCSFDISDASDQKCVAGSQIASGANAGKCAYYTCDTGTPPQCITSSPLPGPFSSATNFYNSTSTCTTLCPLTNPGLGGDCGTAGACQINVCAGIFSCNNDSGNPVTASSADCGYCCCDPNNDTCNILSPDLSCRADQGPCSGSNRGLCCGCTKDEDCGTAFTTNGCSSDGCCRARPNILTTSPAPQENNVCRNAMISIPFDQIMSNGSIDGNVLLLEESADPSCPTGSTQVVYNQPTTNIFAKFYNRMVGWFNSAATFVARALDLNFTALATLPDGNKTYCSVAGSSSHINDSTGTTVYFKPSQVLSPDSEYFVVVRGQEVLENLASSTEKGILSNWEIGLNGGGYQPVPMGGPTFGFFGSGNREFINSYIWSFHTLDGSGPTSGMCNVDRVAIVPSAYIFQNNTNDINENDIDLNNSTFDTVADKDKVYTAQALSASGQILQPVSGYDWNWNWQTSPASIFTMTTIAGLGDDRRIINVPANVTDKTGTVSAEIDMNSGNVFFGGDNANQTVPVQIFLCQNPWPPVISVDNWQPFEDSTACNVNSGDCYTFDYEFYYCRDAGVEKACVGSTPSNIKSCSSDSDCEGSSCGAYTVDDLPALVSDSNLVNIGRSARLVCSNDRDQECTVNSDCGPDNFCIWDILKETYFFRQ